MKMPAREAGNLKPNLKPILRWLNAKRYNEIWFRYLFAS